MSHLRGIDRAHDVDLGPSGHASGGFRFDTLWHTETPARTRKPLPPRCPHLTRFANPCERRDGHPGRHQVKS